MAGLRPLAGGTQARFRGGMGDFSVAHTEDSLLVAVAPTGQVGVDIETVGDVFDRASLQRRMCSPGELARAPRDRARRREWFASLWTAKEAYLKAMRVGLSREPSEIAVDFGAPTFAIRDCGKAVDATTARVALGDRLVACVAL